MHAFYALIDNIQRVLTLWARFKRPLHVIQRVVMAWHILFRHRPYNIAVRSWLFFAFSDPSLATNDCTLLYTCNLAEGVTFTSLHAVSSHIRTISAISRVYFTRLLM